MSAVRKKGPGARPAKRGRVNLAIAATPEVVEELDRLVVVSMVGTTRSAVALAAIQAGLPLVAANLDGGRKK